MRCARTIIDVAFVVVAFAPQVVLLGEGRVGKTSLLHRFVHNTFSDAQTPTLRATYAEKTVRCDDGARVALRVWDTAGQERFHALGPIYYRDADAAVLVYDITDRESFERVKRWVTELKRMTTRDENDVVAVALCVCGNKSDLERSRAVSNADGEAYAKSVGAEFYSASAKANKCVEAVFVSVANRLEKARRARGGAGASRDMFEFSTS